MTSGAAPDEAPHREPQGRSVPGPVLFARYAYPPNALGYCGPADSAGFLGMASEGADLRGLSRLATQIRRGVALSAADRRVQRHRRATRSPSRRGLLDGQRAGDPGTPICPGDIAG